MKVSKGNQSNAIGKIIGSKAKYRFAMGKRSKRTESPNDHSLVLCAGNNSQRNFRMERLKYCGLKNLPNSKNRSASANDETERILFRFLLLGEIYAGHLDYFL